MRLAVIKPDKLKSMREALYSAGGALAFYRQNNEDSYSFNPEDIEEVGDNFDRADIPILLDDSQDKPSFYNAQKVHAFLKRTVKDHRRQSAQEAFWVYLTHAIFPNYLRKRFNPSKDDDKFAKQIDRYWFVREQHVSNAIYRFYLIMEMTEQFRSESWFDGRRYDCSDYSRLICRLADFKMVFQHKAVRSSILLFAILECLRDLEDRLSDSAESEYKVLGKYDIRQMMKDLSLILPVRNLQMMDVDQQLIPEVRKIIVGLIDKNYEHKTKDLEHRLRPLRATWL